MFNIEIVKSNRDLTKREVLAMKDTSDALQIDEFVALADGDAILTPTTWAMLHVTNDAADHGEYDKLVIIDGARKYVTGSATFINSFIDIANEMGSDAYQIKCFARESKNYKGKHFLKCTIV